MLRGGISEPFIPFNEKGKVDYEKLRNAIIWLQDHGVNGFMINGIGGEALALSIEERKKVLETVMDVVKGDDNVSVLVTAYNRDSTIELIRHAADVGAGYAVITQHPVYPLRRPIDYYGYIASKSPIPLILYNEKQLGNLLTPAQVVSVLKIDGFVGYKDSTKDVNHLQEVIEGIPENKTVLAGSDSLIYTTYVLGGKGVVSLIINVFPKLVLDLVKSMEENDLRRGLELQIKVNRVRSLLKSFGFSAGYRAAARLVGNDFGYPFDSTENLSEQELKELEQRLREEGLIP